MEEKVLRVCFVFSGAGEILQWLRELAALGEDLSVIPTTHIERLTTTSNSSFWGFNTFWHPQAPSHICIPHHIHTTKILKIIKMYNYYCV